MRRLESALVLGAIAVAASACGMFGNEDDPGSGGSQREHAGSGSQLTAEQCAFFEVGGKVQICHHSSSTKKPYTIVRTSSSGCINGHSTHPDDYVAVGDPTCNGLGCFPLGAPFDGTVECCNPLWPDASGHCADLCAGVTCGACDQPASCDYKTGRCAPLAAGSVCRAAATACDVAEVCSGSGGACPADGFKAAATACADGVATTINDACDGAGTCAGQPCVGRACIGDGSSATAAAGGIANLGGVSFTVPAGAPDLTITSTRRIPPTSARNGADIVASSPVFAFGPAGTTFSVPLSVSFNVGAAVGGIVYWSHDGVDFDALAADASTGLITVAVDGFSFAVLGTSQCLGRAAGFPCGTAPGSCSTTPNCQPRTVLGISTMTCELPYKAAGTACDDATVCNGHETCNGSGSCSPGTPLPVPAATACASYSCNPSTGIVATTGATGGGPIAFYRFNDTGTVALDSTGHGYSGTYYGSIQHPTGATNDGDRAYGVDGSGAYMMATVPIPESFSVVVWARSAYSDWSDYGWVASARVPNGFIVSPRINPPGSFNYYIGDSSTGNCSGCPVPHGVGAAFLPNDITKWHQYALTFDPSVGWNTYLDGVLEASGSFTNLSTGLPYLRVPAAVNVDVKFGNDDLWWTSRYGNGAIDEARIYGRAISMCELQYAVPPAP